MTKGFFNLLKLSPVVLAATFFAANSAVAEQTTVAQLSNETNSIGQVTSVSQFSDVQPTDWAFQAVQSLVERYGCIAGYPNGTFRGNRAMTRYEFAAGLNACLDRVNELIASATAGSISKEDLVTLERLQDEFSAELATLRGRVDGLEVRTEQLEAKQFSTTTKLKGEAVIAISDVFGGENTNAGESTNTILSNRVRLKLESSFTGKDKLQVRLQGSNTPKLKSPGNMTRLGFDGDNGNDVVINKVNYAFSPAKAVRVKLEAVGAGMDSNVNVFNPVFKSSGSGAISRYGRYSPIYRVASGDAGVTVTLGNKSKKSRSPILLSAGYTTKNQNDATDGIFSGNNSVFGQVDFAPNKKMNVGFAYARAYSDDAGKINMGSTGSSNASSPVAGKSNTNHYSLMASYKLNKKTILSGWYGIADVDEIGGTGSADINYWAASLGIKDFGAKGNTLGFIFGQPPKVTDSNAGTEDSGTSYHLEALYKMKLNKRIAVTPGLLVIFNPEHNNNNDTTYVGTVRTTFKF
ncbi:MAG: iron uptake porin [Cyanobacteria bacterium J06639_18]